MQDIRLVCTVDGAEYKEYEVLTNDQTVGVISWKGELDAASGCWYTTASDGHPRYFPTQEQVIEFLRDDPLRSTTELSAQLKAEANKLIAIAEELEAQSADLQAQDPC
jgi:hypothetical protein